MEVQIKRKTFQKIMHWINKEDREVSGFGKVKYWKETGVFEVLEVYLLKQEVGSAHTDIDEASLGKLMYQTKDDEGDLRFWWHSHVKMDTFWSSVDTDTIKSLGSNGWIVATVFNQMEDMRTAICHKANSELCSEIILHDEVDTFIIDEEVDDATIAEWDAAFKENVETKQFSSYYSNKMWTNDTNTSVMQQDEIDYYKKHGLLGYGPYLEASALGISPTSYLKDLTGMASTNKLMEYERELLTLERNGELHGSLINY